MTVTEKEVIDIVKKVMASDEIINQGSIYPQTVNYIIGKVNYATKGLADPKMVLDVVCKWVQS